MSELRAHYPKVDGSALKCSSYQRTVYASTKIEYNFKGTVHEKKIIVDSAESGDTGCIGLK